MDKQIAAETVAVLRKAADVMISGGYIKGVRYDDKGAHCALGAIDDISSGKDNAIKALADMITEAIPEVGIEDPYNYCTVTRNSAAGYKIAAWNNMLCNSAEEVACMMRATAELIEEEEGLKDATSSE